MNDEVQGESLTEVPATVERDFEDLTLAEAIGDFFRQPFDTARRLLVVTAPSRSPRPMRVVRPVDAAAYEHADRMSLSLSADMVRLALLVLGFISALIGSLVVFKPRFFNGRLTLLEDVPYENALFWWVLAGIMVIVALRFTGTRAFDYDDEYKHAISDAVGVRLAWLLLSLPLLLGGFLFSANNKFTLFGVLMWLAGTACIAWAFIPRDVIPLASIRRGLRNILLMPRQETVAFVLLAIIMVVAAYARFNDLDGLPAEMTSDHIEKVLDAQRIVHGDRDIFLANNGGREPLHFYTLAFVASLTGGQVTFAHLKVVAALESLLGVLLMFVLGRVAIGDRDKRLGLMLGLALALFAGVGYWHLAVTRVSLRIMLTPLVTTAFLIYVIRLIRHNRREDAVMLGLVIGVGIYSYQALRMLPVVAVVAAAYIFIFVARDNRQRFAAVFNLIVIAAVSFAVFVPMFKYSTEHPEDFWRRAQGRMLGDDVITETLPDGTIINRSPTIGERLSAFWENVPQLGDNLRRALLMFTYRADVAWLHTAPNYPTFEPAMGALLICGAAGWVIWALQKREYSAIFVLLVLVLMLIPSVVALANPDENPSNTRASGAMPVAYLLAAFGIINIVRAVGAVIPRRFANAAGIVIVGGVAFVSLGWANMVLFGPYNDYYQNSWSPQREAGLFFRGVAQSDGAWGNVFILAAAHFFDYRGVALEAGLPSVHFPNGDIQPIDLADKMMAGLMTEGLFKLDPNRYIVIMYHIADVGTTEMLKQAFPEGRDMIIDTRRDTPWLSNEQYRVYRIPPPGIDGLIRYFESRGMRIPPEVEALRER